FLAGLRIERAELAVVGRADEHQTAGRDRGSRAAAAADVRLAEEVVAAERRLPRDLARVRVDGDEPRPWRTLTRERHRPAVGIRARARRERVERTDAVDRGAIVRELRPDRIEAVLDAGLLLLHPADERRVVRVHVDVAGARIGRRAAPVDAARAAGE